MMRKDKVYKSRELAARRKRYRDRCERKKAEKTGKKSTPKETRALRNEIRLELENGKDFDLRGKCQEMTPTLVEILRDLANDVEPRVALPACRLLLEYAHGKPVQPSEINATVTTKTIMQPAWEDCSPTEVARFYREMMQAGEDVEFQHRPSTNPYVAPALAAPQPSSAISHAIPESPPRYEGDPEPVERAPEKKVLVMRPVHEGECQPIEDSKCAWCRKMFVDAQKLAAEDARLRGADYGRPKVPT